MTAEKSSKKGLAILFVGVMIGLGIGIAVCVTNKTQTVVAHANENTQATQPASKDTASKEAFPTRSAPLPKLYPPPSQFATAPDEPPAASAAPQISTSSTYQPASFQPSTYNSYGASGQIAAAPPQQIILQSPDGSLAMPGVNTVPAGTPESTASNINPNWTIGKSGLIQNPCVDPPSAHGRQTGMY